MQVGNFQKFDKMCRTFIRETRVVQVQLPQKLWLHLFKLLMKNFLAKLEAFAIFPLHQDPRKIRTTIIYSLIFFPVYLKISILSQNIVWRSIFNYTTNYFYRFVPYLISKHTVWSVNDFPPKIAPCQNRPPANFVKSKIAPH